MSSATTQPFFADSRNEGLFKSEYGFYWQRAKKDEHGRIIKTEEWSMDERKEASKKGQAMPDGSFPIKNTNDLHNAVSDWGRAGSKPSVKDHIVDRAKALDASHLLPDDWQDKKEVTMDDGSKPADYASNS
jgi:hypothetical protein